MRTNLPLKPQRNECGIVNLDCAKGAGTHWVAYVKKGNSVQYFDSFGNLKPPLEIISYLGQNRAKITYNYKQLQNYNSTNCGQLCVNFLLQHV